MTDVPHFSDRITVDWLNENLTAGDFEKAEFTDLQLAPIGESVGFLGDLFRISLDYARDADAYPSSLILKLPTYRDDNRETGKALAAYEREAMFYRHCPDSPANPPKHYLSVQMGDDQEFMMLIEDLGNCRFVAQSGEIDVADARIGLEGLARHHAHYWDTPELRNMNWLRSYEEWADIYPPQIETGWPIFEKHFSYLIPAELKDAFPLGNDLYSDITRHVTRSLPSTLMHGDARIENMAIDGSASARFYDWQVCACGPAAYDVVYYLGSSLDPDTWLDHGQSLIDSYLAELKNSGVTGYERSDLDRDMQLCACLLIGFVGVVGNLFRDPGPAEINVVEATIPRFMQIMADLDVNHALREFADTIAK
jgi:hypothetical protein